MTALRTAIDERDLLHRGVLVLAVSALAGLLLAGVMLPLIGGVGLVARAGADSFNKLPAELEEPPLPVRSRILAADGTLLAEIYLNENRVEVPISQVPDVAQRAILAIEDDRFYSHGGIDLKGFFRAFVRNTQAGEVQQGGSTITQQYVKNVLIESAPDVESRKKATERSAARKLREARYAMALEKRYSKRQILEKYLNIAYFGQGVYGIGTAAQHFFGKPVQQLTLEESALLAGMVKNPRLYDPEKNPKTSLARRDLVLRRMAEVGFASRTEVRVATAKPMTLKITKVSDTDRSIAPFFYEYMRDKILDDTSGRYGDSPEARARLLFQGGLTIRTTLDPKMQRAAQAAIATTLNAPTDPGAAVVIVKPGTGEIKAMAVQNRITGSKKVNLATGGSTGRQGGSTFKVFTLAAAIKKGLPLGYRIYSPACYRSRIFANPGSGCYRNADVLETGLFDIPKGTWDSVNTFYVQLQERVGTLAVADMARDLGIGMDSGGLPWPGQPAIAANQGSLTLGAEEVSPLDMANAYATIAARGVRCEPTPILSVADAKGVEIAKLDTAESCQRSSLTPEQADTVSAVLQGVITHGTGRAAAIGRPAAGKTGTTQNFGDAWFVGYTPDLATASWIGDPRGNTYQLRNLHGFRNVYGGTLPAIIWQKAMFAAHVGLPARRFPPAPASAYIGVPVTVPNVTGLSVEEARAAMLQAGLTPVVDPIVRAAFPVPAGAIAASNPPAGARAYAGSAVFLYVSNGQLAPSPTPTPTPTVTPSRTPSPTPTVRPTTPPPSPTPKPTPSCHGNKCSPSPTASPAPPTSEPQPVSRR